MASLPTNTTLVNYDHKPRQVILKFVYSVGRFLAYNTAVGCQLRVTVMGCLLSCEFWISLDR